MCLLVISVAASVSTGLLYANARHALSVSLAAQQAGRAQRIRADDQFCKAINQGRRINNRDRVTFLRSRVETRRDLKVVKDDPVLARLLKKSLVQTALELRARPHLNPLPCKALVPRRALTTTD